ncbi:MAG TPA: phage tail protein [Burkholderiales bacterium]|nr:phage tail protein [Burkholderiales bacterium]
MAHYYPPPVFHFKVEVQLAGLRRPDGKPAKFPPNDNDVRFAEASGLSMEMTSEEMPEGGENRFVQKYPLRAKYPELVLKRGLLVRSSVFEWMRGAIQDFLILPTDVFVKLLNPEHEPLMTWHLVNAYPTKWTLGDLNASGNAVAIETLQLYYQYFSVEPKLALED